MFRRLGLITILTIGAIWLLGGDGWAQAASEADRHSKRATPKERPLRPPTERERSDRVSPESVRPRQNASQASRPTRPAGLTPSLRSETASRRPERSPSGERGYRGRREARGALANPSPTAPVASTPAPRATTTAPTATALPNAVSPTPRNRSGRDQRRDHERRRGYRTLPNSPDPRPAPPATRPAPPANRPPGVPQVWRAPQRPSGPPRRYRPRPVPFHWRGAPYWSRSPFWRGARRPWYSSLFWFYNLRGFSSSRAVFTRSDGGLFVAAAHNLSLGLFWEYKRARYLKTAKYDKDLQTVFDTVEESVVLAARANPNLNGFELERLTLNSFQRFVEANVESVALNNGFYSMKLVSFRGKTNDWVATPVKDADIPTIIKSLSPELLASTNSNAWSGQN